MPLELVFIRVTVFLNRRQNDDDAADDAEDDAVDAEDDEKDDAEDEAEDEIEDEIKHDEEDEEEWEKTRTKRETVGTAQRTSHVGPVERIVCHRRTANPGHRRRQAATHRCADSTRRMAAPGGPRRARSGLAFTVALDDMIDVAPAAPAPKQPPQGRKPLAEARQPTATAIGAPGEQHQRRC